jgi:hypothetical protein
MQLTASSYALWLLSIALSVLLCALLLQRRVVGRLRFFFLYIIVNLLKSLFVWYLFRKFGYQSREAYRFSSIAQAVVYGARMAAVMELCYRILRSYRGVWGLAWRLLGACAFTLTVVAAVQATQHRQWIFTFVSNLERGLELAAAVTLVLLFAFIAYYQIQPPRLEITIALGLATFSIIQVAFQSFLQSWFPRFVALRTFNQLYYQGILIIWLFALRNPVPAERPAPAILDPAVYAQVTPQLDARLQKLNSRLLELFRSRGKKPPPPPSSTNSE